MKTITDVNQWRVKRGPLASDPEIGNYGAFCIPLKPKTYAMCVVSDGDETGWEHVSVHIRFKTSDNKVKMRTPTWKEMCTIKDLFWHEHETVIQFHPPRSEYVNNHPHCLHLWRPESEEIPRPDPKLVGLLGLAEEGAA